MKAPCLQINRELEQQAQIAEQRKVQAIDRLTEKLTQGREKDAFHRAMEVLIDADQAALGARGK